MASEVDCTYRLIRLFLTAPHAESGVICHSASGGLNTSDSQIAKDMKTTTG